MTHYPTDFELLTPETEHIANVRYAQAVLAFVQVLREPEGNFSPDSDHIESAYIEQIGYDLLSMNDLLNTRTKASPTAIIAEFLHDQES